MGLSSDTNSSISASSRIFYNFTTNCSGIGSSTKFLSSEAISSITFDSSTISSSVYVSSDNFESNIISSYYISNSINSSSVVPVPIQTSSNDSNINNISSVISTPVQISFDSSQKENISSYYTKQSLFSSPSHLNFNTKNSVYSTQYNLTKTLYSYMPNATSLNVVSYFDNNTVLHTHNTMNSINSIHFSNISSTAIVTTDSSFRGGMLAFSSVCSQGAEVVVDVTMGYTGGGGVDSNSVNNIIGLISKLTNQFMNSPNDLTGYYRSGDLICSGFSGGMISNKDAVNKFYVGIAALLISKEGIESGKFFEYISSDGNPEKNIGLVCVTNGDNDKVTTSMKAWSQGKSAMSTNRWSGSFSRGKSSQCFLDWSARKSGNKYADPNYGQCNYGIVKSGKTASDACGGLSGDNLAYYNSFMNNNFANLQPGDPVCCSLGNGKGPDIGYGYSCSSGHSRIVQNMNLGWNTKDKENYGNNHAADDALNKISNQFKGSSNDMTAEWASADDGNVKCAAFFGAQVSNSDSADTIIKWFMQNIHNEGLPASKYIEMKDLSNPLVNAGIFCSSDSSTLGDMATAIKNWSQGKSASVVASGVQPSEYVSLCYLDYNSRKSGNQFVDWNYGTCNYNRVQSGQTAEDACKLNGDNLVYYNKGVDFSKIQENQPICCSLGTMPDFRPHKNSDGSCFTHTFAKGEGCGTLFGTYYPLSEDDLMSFNKQTFNWLGCSNGHPWVGDIICLSDGTPPRPMVNPEAECGPQAPGDKYNAECPLNACCSQYGFCGYTDEFCGRHDSLTNAPGTTGCMSNCDQPNWNAPSSENKQITYYDGTDPYSAKKISVTDITGYSHIHMAFGTIFGNSPPFSINTDSISNEYNLLRKVNAKKILTFGGWDFSTSPSTYSIFRDAIGKYPEEFAQNVADFLNKDENQFLDGVDFDWEYPGAPDIPGIPPDDVNNGKQLLKFVTSLKSKLPSSKTVSLAIPSSFWYLKPYPIKDIVNVVDYVVIMTYDLHGQFDYANKYSGGDHVFCHTNITDTNDSLKMMVRAGVDSSKVVVGIANYARSYELAGKGSDCNSAGCEFVGPASGATPGKYSKVAGVLTEDDLKDIIATKPYRLWNDDASKCSLMIYDDNNWVGWTTDNNYRREYYHSIGFGGTSLWVVNDDTVNINVGGDDGGDGGNSDDDNDEDLGFDGDETNDDLQIMYAVDDKGNDACATLFKVDISAFNSLYTIDVYTSLFPDCRAELETLFLLSNATAAYDEINVLYNEKRDDYNKNYKYYSEYFAKNMSYAYQNWWYENKDEANWFICKDDNFDDVDCKDLYRAGGNDPNSDQLCNNNCCFNSKCDEGHVCDRNNKCCNQQKGLSASYNFASYMVEANSEYELNQMLYDISVEYPPVWIQNDTSDEGIEFSTFSSSNDKMLLYGMEPNPNLLSTTLPQFSSYVGYQFNNDLSQFYVQSYYVFQKYMKGGEGLCLEDDGGHNITARCITLPYDHLFNKNPMDSMTIENITDTKTLIDTAYNSLINRLDYPVTIYESSYQALLTFSNTVSGIQGINDFGHKYHSVCTKLRILEILGPILDAFVGILALFVGPEIGVILGLVDQTIQSSLSGDWDIASMLEGALLGEAGRIIKIPGLKEEGGFYNIPNSLTRNLDMRNVLAKIKQIDSSITQKGVGCVA